ncbi:hypothetical protein LPJ73_001113 [Coemansia sp. RSA 2703]|nr:hypothetical protein LPJ73_001113 [Coemansia sp. RSA 2703]KAJ2375487.1 hypothetical protein IW150_002524 [Coemansia sp. RSA 2607]KAJ2397082.1 hypothetical protein GGI05_000819 [Coemansia sp. RSA 2603]
MRLSYVLSTLIILILGIITASANTEIKHFVPAAIATDTNGQANVDISAVLRELDQKITTPTIMTAPYTSADMQTIACQQSSNSSISEKEQWYLLENLVAGMSYELRVSYAATTPADFSIEIFTLEQMASMYNLTFFTVVSPMYARVIASYAGLSVVPGLENQRIPYNFVLEKHVFGLPMQALKLIAVILAVVFVTFAWIVPRVLAMIDKALADDLKQKNE